MQYRTTTPDSYQLPGGNEAKGNLRKTNAAPSGSCVYMIGRPVTLQWTG